MSTGSPDPIDEALAGDASAHDVLDLVDDAIEGAAGKANSVTLAALADRLDAVAAERGGEWHMLAIAAMRARALATPSGKGGVAAAPDTAGSEAPPAAQLPGSTLPRDEAVQPAYGGWWVRTVAYLLDCVVLGSGLALLAVFVPDVPETNSEVANVMFVGLTLAYFAGMHAFHDGATVGKAVFGIAVRGPDESGVGFGRAAGRAVATWVLWFTFIGGLVDTIMLGADHRKRSLHDKIAGTVVVRTRGARTTSVV